MALSYTQIALNTGTTENEGIGQKVFSFDFDFINSADIKARLTNDPEHANPTWTAPIAIASVDVAAKKITLSANPSDTAGVDGDSAIRIYRATTTEPIVDFQAGSRLSEADLDNAYKQGLYAAQEVQENASTTGAGAGLTDDCIDHNHIKEGAVRASEIEDGVVGTDELANDSVTTAKTANTLDWKTEGSTIILPTTNRNLSATDENYGWSGTLPVGRGGTGYSSLKTSHILDRVTGACDGSVVTRSPDVSPSTITLPNVSTIQTNTTSWADVTGSKIQYIPHSEATRIEYEFNFTFSKDSSQDALTYFRLLFTDEGDDTAVNEVSKARFCLGGNHYKGDIINFKWVFGLYNKAGGSGPDTSMGVVGPRSPSDPWNSWRWIYLQVKEDDNTPPSGVGGVPTMTRRRVGAGTGQLTSNVLTVVTDNPWIDKDPGRKEPVYLGGTWANATTDPKGAHYATYVSTTSFTIPLTGANQGSYDPGATAYVYSWVPDSQASSSRIHAIPHFTDETVQDNSSVRVPILTVTSIK